MAIVRSSSATKVQLIPVFYGGSGVINTTNEPAAITRAEGQIISAQVLLFAYSGAVLVASTQSNTLGEWEITGLDPSHYYWARIVDTTKTLNGAVLDWLQPVTPP